MYACASGANRGATLTAFFFLLFVLFYLLGTTADGYFCPQVEELCDRLGLTPRVAGVTLLSLGNGAPDVFAGISAVRNNQLSLVVGQLTGGGMFVTSVVAGGVIFVSGGIRARLPWLRDVMMYFSAVLAFCILIVTDALNIITASILLIFYLLFVGHAWWGDRILLKKVTEGSMKSLSNMPMLERSATQAELLNKEYRISRKARMNFGTILDHLSKTSEGTDKHSLVGFLAGCVNDVVRWCESPFNVLRNLTVVNVVSESWSVENRSRIRGSFALMFTPLFISFWQGFHGADLGGMPAYGLMLIIGFVLGVIFLVICPTDEPPSFSLPLLILGFITAAAWVDLFASELVDLLTTIGRILSISEVTMGATVLAWGNCIGDLTSDILLAKNKREGMAITACFAGPMFNLLIVVGFGVLISSISNPVKASLVLESIMSFTFLLTTSMITLLTAFAFGKFAGPGGNRLPKKYSYFLWSVYGVFIIAMLCAEFVVNPTV